jgi:ABC-type bacteriocin/lantibiotic exporter with double-glycine peptidase domain
MTLQPVPAYTAAIAPEQPEGMAWSADQTSPYAYCLPRLLTQLGWRGDLRQLAAAIAGSPATMDLVDFRNTLANLRFRSWGQRTAPTRVELRLLPCLYVDRSGYPSLLDLTPEGQLGYVNHRGEGVARSLRGGGRAYYFAQVADVAPEQRAHWFQNLLYRFQSQITLLYGISFVINLLGLAVPYYIRGVYNLVIPTRELDTLQSLGVGVALMVAVQMLLINWRSRLLARIGARLDMIIGSSVMERLLGMSLAQLQMLSPSQHLAQLRSFEALRAYVTGPLALAALDLPFVPIFIIAIISIGQWIVLVPLLFIAVALGSVLLTTSYTRGALHQEKWGQGNLHGLLIELVERFPEIKTHGMEALWLSRIRGYSAQSVFSEMRRSRLQGLGQILATDLGRLAGALTLAAGAVLAMQGQGITLGAMIASMFFVWRIFAPIQVAFAALLRYPDQQPVMAQLNQLLTARNQEEERGEAEFMDTRPQFQGKLEFRNVFIRLNPYGEPTLLNVSFNVAPGELVVLTGGDESGKSTLLRLVAQIYPLQSGSISLDGIDSHQIPLSVLRSVVAFLPEHAQIFPGTIYQNLLLGNPMNSEAEVQEVCAQLGLLEWIEKFGFHTPVFGGGGLVLPVAISQGIAVARVLLTHAPIFVLDDPMQGLTPDQQQRLLQILKQRQGQQTTLVATLYQPLLEMADRIIVLSRGSVAFNGSPNQLRTAQTIPN